MGNLEEEIELRLRRPRDVYAYAIRRLEEIKKQIRDKKELEALRNIDNTIEWFEAAKEAKKKRKK